VSLGAELDSSDESVLGMVLGSSLGIELEMILGVTEGIVLGFSASVGLGEALALPSDNPSVGTSDIVTVLVEEGDNVGAPVGEPVGDTVAGKSMGDNVGSSVGESVGDAVVDESVVDTDVGDSLGEIIVSTIVGESVGESVGDEVAGESVENSVGDTVVGDLVKHSVGDDVVGESVVGAEVREAIGLLVLHSSLHTRGQKNCALFPVTGSTLTHRLLGFLVTQLSQSFSSSLSKRNVPLFSQSPWASVGENVGAKVADEVLHSSLHTRGQKICTFSPVTGSTLSHRLLGFLVTQLPQSFPSSLSKRNVPLFSQSPRASVGENVGVKVGDEVLHSSLHTRGQKICTFSPVTGSTLSHRLLGFLVTQLPQSFPSSLSKRNVSLFSQSSRESVGAEVGSFVGF
jgi:hypothetical protein